MGTVEEMLEQMKMERMEQDAAKAKANTTVTEIMRRVEEKEVDQALKFIRDAVETYDKLHGNLHERRDARRATIKKLEGIKKKLKDRMQDKKIADTVANVVSGAGGIAAFFPPAGTVVALVAAGTSIGMQVSSDIVNAVLDADEIADAEFVLNKENVLESEMGRLMDQLEMSYKMLDKLQIEYENVQALVITAAKYESAVSVEYKSLLKAVMANTPLVGTLTGNDQDSEAYMDPVTSTFKTVKTGITVANLFKVAPYTLKAFGGLAIKMGKPALARSTVAASNYYTKLFSTTATNSGTRVVVGAGTKVFAGATAFLSLYQIVALWTSTENEAVKQVEDHLSLLKNQLPQFEEAAAELDKVFSKDDLVALPASG